MEEQGAAQDSRQELPAVRARWGSAVTLAGDVANATTMQRGGAGVAARRRPAPALPTRHATKNPGEYDGSESDSELSGPPGGPAVRLSPVASPASSVSSAGALKRRGARGRGARRSSRRAKTAPADDPRRVVQFEMTVPSLPAHSANEAAAATEEELVSPEERVLVPRPNTSNVALSRLEQTGVGLVVRHALHCNTLARVDVHTAHCSAT